MPGSVIVAPVLASIAVPSALVAPVKSGVAPATLTFARLFVSVAIGLVFITPVASRSSWAPSMLVILGARMVPPRRATRELLHSTYCDVWRIRDGKLAELRAFVVEIDGEG